MTSQSIDLPLELAVAGGMFVVTVVIHLTGLMTLIKLAHFHLTHARTPWLALDRVIAPTLLALGLFAVHSLEVMAYAAMFKGVGATHTWEEAIYASAAAYSTAGLAGPAAAQHWRVVGGLESLNGMLLIGWSTAFLFQNLQRILVREEDHPLPEGAIAKEIEEIEEEIEEGSPPRREVAAR